jgi:4-diphosphocytidyl-2-C-methyl-D-erythritol kinase
MDVVGHGMSGSGTSYFGICRHARHALRVARRLQASGVGSVFAVQSCR